MGCRADKISRNWKVAEKKCRADGCRANRLSRRWGVAQKKVAQMGLTRRTDFGVPGTLNFKKSLHDFPDFE